MSWENVPAKWRFLIKKERKTPVRQKKEGLSIRELILRAVYVGKDRNGFSYAALMKALAAAGYDVEGKRHHVKSAIRGLLNNGDLILHKGWTFSGSYKLSKAAEAAVNARCREEADVNFAAMEAAAAEKAAAAAAAAEQEADAAAAEQGATSAEHEADPAAAEQEASAEQEAAVAGKETAETGQETAAAGIDAIDAVMEPPKNT